MDQRDSTIESILQEFRTPQAEDSDILARNSLFTRTDDAKRQTGRSTLRRSSDLRSMRHQLTLLSTENQRLQDTVESLKKKCSQYEQEIELGHTERSSLLDYLSHFRSENQLIESKLEVYTDRIKTLEQSNLVLEQRFQQQQELIRALDKEKGQLRAQLHRSEALTLLDLNLGPPEGPRKERVASVRSCKRSASPKRLKTPQSRSKKEQLCLKTDYGKLFRPSSTRKSLYE